MNCFLFCASSQHVVITFLFLLFLLFLLLFRRPIKRVFATVCFCVLWLFPFLKRFLDERLIANWREKQEELKRMLVVKDTEEWQRLMWEGDDDDDENSPSVLRYVGGVDVSFGSDGVSACASLVVCDLKRRSEVVYEDFIPFHLTTPYRPGDPGFPALKFSRFPGSANLARSLEKARSLKAGSLTSSCPHRREWHSASTWFRFRFSFRRSD